MTFTWILDESKYLKTEEVRKLMDTCRELIRKHRSFLAVRNCFMVELGLFTGLRVKEMANLNCGDLLIGNEQSTLIVKRGKGDKKRIVKLNSEFKEKCLKFLKYKEKINQSISEDSPLLCSFSGKRLTKRALQKSFKKCMRIADLPSHYGIHSLRHTYGSHLYKASNHNLRLVQEQLGHTSIRTTEAYANLMATDVNEAFENLYK